MADAVLEGAVEASPTKTDANGCGQCLAFGIPSLDELLGRPTKTAAKDIPSSDFGIHLRNRENATSVCLIGPDGTGKSVLALHLAAHYAATSGPETRILYASTDLSYDKALSIWENFALDRPRERLESLEKVLSPGRAQPRALDDPHLERVRLHQFLPLIPERLGSTPYGDPRVLTDYLMEDLRTGEYRTTDPGPSRLVHSVAFVDLESYTAGDDWGLLNRLLAILDRPDPVARGRDLLVIDAVEGLETLGGKHDAFGQERERRSRIAQILRAAKGKCHVVFVVEESSEREERLPEEFVSDAVIRLRVERQRDYSRRTIEIEKLRGQAYIRGRHDCLIRSGKGSRTGSMQNPDDPELLVVNDANVEVPTAYFQVIPSLHYLSRAVMEAQAEAEKAGALVPRPQIDPRLEEAPDQRPGLCGFGIKYLDDMIGDQGRAWSEAVGDAGPVPEDGDSHGLPWGSVTALIGEEGTYKVRLGQAFLAQAFVRERGNFADGSLASLDPRKGVALFLTVQDVDARRLAASLRQHQRSIAPPPSTQVIENYKKLPKDEQMVDPWRLDVEALNEMEANTLCRRLEIHHLSPAILFHIIHEFVQAGLKRLAIIDPPQGRGERTRDPGRVRLVIDDWAAIQNAYPEVRDDPLFLPFLLFYLQRRGITALILDTRSGRPSRDVEEDVARSLRALATHHLYTWRVTFFGEKRVAIAALPPISDDKRVVVRELRPFRVNEGLIVDPRFEYYTGLEDDRAPTLVPLKIHLFADSDAAPAYLEDVAKIFARLRGEPTDQIVHLEKDSYDMLRDFALLHGDTALEHTLVLQVDEFWTQDGRAMENLHDYLTAETALESGSDSIEDPFWFFQTSKARGNLAAGDSIKRHEEFLTIGYSLIPPTAEEAAGKSYVRRVGSVAAEDAAGQGPRQTLEPTHRKPPRERVSDRVPYTMDFGFLLVDDKAWEAADQSEKVGPKGQERTISAIREALALPKDAGATPPAAPPGPASTRAEVPVPKDASATPPANPTIIPWRTFFQACTVVAHHASNRPRPWWGGHATPPTPRLAFDLDHSTAESLSAFVLELWASEILAPGLKDKDNKECFRGARHHKRGDSLAELIGLDRDVYRRRALYRAWVLLETMVPPSRFQREHFRFKPRPALPEAVASRHWYSTACPAASKSGENDLLLVPLRMPGNYTCRGDWFLSIIKGSRSRRAGERAIDLLCSRRANITRMQLGMGLPTRGFDVRGHLNDAEFRSPLRVPDDGWRMRNLRLRDFRMLGASPIDSEATPSGEFRWLWRSLIADYDRNSRVWSKWIAYALCEMREPESKCDDPSHKAAFALYDRLEGWVQAKAELDPEDQKRFDRFDQLCRELRDALNRATIVRGNL